MTSIPTSSTALLLWFLCCVLLWNGVASLLQPGVQNTAGVVDRQEFLAHSSLIATAFLNTLMVAPSSSAISNDNNFRTAGFDRKEYTNSIVASRDTNISPAEVYDTLLKLRRTKKTSPSTTASSPPPRALDVGAGAGVSTQVLWEMGYHDIDAVDWSGEAWETNVVECPESVRFFELDDERFLQRWKQSTTSDDSKKYDVVAFNFAVNREKALLFCQTVLNEDGILLAPVNGQQDYWLKQVYTLFDAKGNTLWTANDVGAWSVQFQPDVTQDTCSGIWCAPFNGFKKMKSQRE